MDKCKKTKENGNSFLHFNEKTQEQSIAITNLFDILKDIKVSPELIAQNQYKSVNGSGDVDFYY